MNLSCGCTKQLFQPPLQLLSHKTDWESTTFILLYFILYTPWWVWHTFVASCEVLVGWKLSKALLISLDCQSVQWQSSNHTTLSITPARAELSSFLQLPWLFKAETGGAMTNAKSQGGSWVKIFEKKGNKRKISVKLETGLWESWLERR